MERSKIQLTNECNMQLMARYPDNYFELGIIDPPYGIDAGNKTYGKRKIKHNKKEWDSETPNDKYFEELFRVSKNQIIWGGNYFDLPRINGWIIWDKDRKKETTFSDGEMAWTNFLNLLKIKKLKYDGFLGADLDGRIHPTQKPVKLYEWLLTNYAKEGDKILDTHLGSGSIAIACHNLKFDLVGCELDKEYFDAAVKRLENHKNQLQIF